ncbi:MAG: TonB-dependent receptor [Polyangiaceae bacterium]
MWRAHARRAIGAWVALVFAALWITLAPASAAADDYADEADLQFELGAELYAKGDFRGALEHFLASNRLVNNKNVVFNIARTFEKLGDQGTGDDAVRYYANAHRYYIDALQGETDAQTRAQLEGALAHLAPKVAVLSIETTPPGATVYIDRKDLGSRGKTPAPLALPPGRYKVIVEADGYEPAEVDAVEAKRGEATKVTLALKEILGTVKVDIDGGGSADVHVGDERAKPACTAPCEFKVRPGTYLLYFTHEGFDATPRQVVVTANAVVLTTARLSPLSGSMFVDADERGAGVEVDGVLSGFTPALVQNVRAGKRSVRVLMRGFAPLVKEVEVKPNQQTEVTGLKLEPLRQVQAVSRESENIEDAPSSLTIIDGQELRLFGYPTIAESLRGVRGFYLQTDRAYWSAGVRGIGEPNDYGNRLLILSDGAILNDDLLNSSYIGPDGRNDLDDVERIEVVRGPGSLLYGTGAFSGVVNLVPRFHDNPSSGFAGSGVYDNRVAHARAGFHVNFDKDAGMWASASASHSDGFAQEMDVLNEDGTTTRRLIHNVDKFDAVGTAGSIWWRALSAQWSYQRRDQHLSAGQAGTAVDDSRSLYFDERFLGEIRYEPRFNDYVQLFLRAHANHYHFHGLYVLPDPDASLLEDYYGTWFGTEARVAISPIPELKIVGGGEVQFHPFTALRGTEVESDLETPAPDGEYMNEENSFTLGAPYVLVEGSPIKWFHFSAGIRVDIYSTFGAIALPRGAVVFKPIEGGALKIMAGRAFRAPSVYEQFYNDGGFSQAKATDPERGLELGPESIVSTEVEYSQRFLEDWVALGAVHTSYIENIINTVPDAPGSDVIRYANSDVPVLTIGGEVELRREWRQGWMLAAQYGYQRAQYLNPTDPSLQDNPRVINAPEHNASIKFAVPIQPEVATLGVRATLEAPRRISLDSDEETDPAAVVDLTMGGYASRFGLRYTIGVYNLFDWTYSLPVSDTYRTRVTPQNGRTFMVNLTLNYPPAY